jgi:Tol biopolymer transport system component
VSGRPDELDARSDVYQLGIILFELLTGQLPYDVENLSVTEAMRVIKEMESPQLWSLDTRFRGDLTTIAGKALDKDPQRRYLSAAEIAADIRRYLADQPIAARPPSLTYRAGKLIRRRRGLIGTLGAGLVLVAAAAALWWAGQEPIAGPEIRARRIVAESYRSMMEVHPAISPDGQSVVCTGGYELAVAAIGTGEVRTLLAEEEGRLFYWVEWHPDGKRVLTDEGRDGRHEVWATDVVTGRREPILEANEPTYPAVSPDGGRLALLRNDHHEIRITSITGGETATIVQVKEPAEIAPPAWSPDGTRLAYTVTHKPDWRVTLEMTDLAGNRSMLIEDTGINKSAGDAPRICWLPDGRLVFNKWTSHHEGEFVVVTVDNDSGQLVEGPRSFFGMEGARLGRPSASADGERMTFVRSVWERRLMLLDMSGGTQAPKMQRVCVADWTAYPGVWSSDGQKLFFGTERRIGDLDIYVRDFDASREEPFWVTPQSEFPQCLTPDGSHLLYLQDEDLMSIPVAGGVSRHVLRLGYDYTGTIIRCAVAPGSTCVAVELEGAEVVVKKLDLDGSFSRELLRVAVEVDAGRNVGLDLSPDGSQFVITETTGRIRVFDLMTGASRDLRLAFEGNPQRVYWSRSGRFLYVSGMKGAARFWIARLDLQGGCELLHESRETWFGWPVPSPDDGSVAYQAVTYRPDVWMIEGF